MRVLYGYSFGEIYKEFQNCLVIEGVWRKCETAPRYSKVISSLHLLRTVAKHTVSYLMNIDKCTMYLIVVKCFFFLLSILNQTREWNIPGDEHV